MGGKGGQSWGLEWIYWPLTRKKLAGFPSWPASSLSAAERYSMRERETQREREREGEREGGRGGGEERGEREKGREREGGTGGERERDPPHTHTHRAL